jgi:hypothetical protein
LPVSARRSAARRLSSAIASAIGVELVAATDGGGVGTDRPAAAFKLRQIGRSPLRKA